MNEITYRDADIEDSKTIQDLAVELCEWESQQFDENYDWQNPKSEQWKESIEHAINSTDYIVMIVEINKKAIWFILWWVSESAFYWKFEKLWELHKLYVNPEHRWKWIWEKLMKIFMEFMTEKDVDRTEIYTFYDNDVNDFYEKFWFEKKALFLRKDNN